MKPTPYSMPAHIFIAYHDTKIIYYRLLNNQAQKVFRCR